MLAAAAASWFTPAVALEPGAEPAEVVREYHETLKRSTRHEAIWPYYVAGKREAFVRKFPPQIRDKAFYMMRSTAPSEIRVQDTRVDGDRAEVLVTATNDRRLYGEATLQKQDGEWRLVEVVWKKNR